MTLDTVICQKLPPLEMIYLVYVKKYIFNLRVFNYFKSVNYCLLRPDRLKRIWEIRGNVIPETNSPFRSDFLAQLKELGFENMTDEVAITTKTKEKYNFNFFFNNIEKLKKRIIYISTKFLILN